MEPLQDPGISAAESSEHDEIRLLAFLPPNLSAYLQETITLNDVELTSY
jgi:hypothetical protein